MDPLNWGSQLPSSNDVPTEHVPPRSSTWEEGGNSASHQNIWEFPTEEWDMAAYAPELHEKAEIASDGVATNAMFDRLRIKLEGFALASTVALHRTTRLPYHTSRLTGWEYVKEVLEGRDERFYKVFKMTKEIFEELCFLLVNKYGWVSNRKDAIRVQESLAIFVSVLRGWVTDDIDERFQRSRSIVHRHVNKILDCMIQFEQDEIAPWWSTDDATIHPYLRSREPYRFFQHCIGAIDGTHVYCRPPPNQGHLYFGRKGAFTMNIMAACDFDLCFTFASVGWQGTWHDYAIFKEVLRNDAIYHFPHPPTGKYYLVDSGYANRTGYLAPYKGCKYHLPDFRRGQRQVRAGKELFNRWHSSLRSSIERAFGVWKKRWRMLNNATTYSVDKQSRLVVASMAIHNFIRRRCPQDELWRKYDWTQVPEYAFEDIPDHNDHVQEMEDTNQQEWDYDCDDDMNRFRDSLKSALNEHQQRQRRR